MNPVTIPLTIRANHSWANRNEGMTSTIKFPYAVRDFEKLIIDEYLYLDRTDRIPLIENAGKELLFLRPSRFGKSLLLSMLMNYYDVAQADAFDRLFGKLAIGKNPTPLHNQYLVMQWDFSYIQSHGPIQEIESSLHDHLNEWISIFAEKYSDILTSEIRIHANSLASFSSAVAAADRTPYKLYLFIDEYDNFANEVMMGVQGKNQQRYSDLVSGEGMFKTLFKNVKGAGAGKGLDRVFMTGVSPIVMSDVTSGSNVTKDITWRPYFNDLCGFREGEVRPLVEQVTANCGLPASRADEAMNLMRIFYNGSRFTLRDANTSPKVYNPTLTFYFLEELQEFCLYPNNMLDSNLAPDYNKLAYISSHPTGEQLLLSALHRETRLTISEIGDRFGMKEMLEIEKQWDRLASLLCYLGGLTIGGQAPDGKWLLEIPNLVMRKLYAERGLELILPKNTTRKEASDAADALYSRGEIEPLCSFVAHHDFKVFSNRDYQHADELTIKTIFLTLLYHDTLYIMDSEPEIERTYGDLIMLIRPEMRRFTIFDILLEFKFIKPGTLGLTGEQVQQQSEQELKSHPMVKEKFEQARTQLQKYRQRLQAKYGDILKLRTYTVVAVGFDRLLWEEV